MYDVRSYIYKHAYTGVSLGYTDGTQRAFSSPNKSSSVHQRETVSKPCTYIHTYIHTYVYMYIVFLPRQKHFGSSGRKFSKPRMHIHTYIRIYIYIYTHTHSLCTETSTLWFIRARNFQSHACTNSCTYIHTYIHT